jgi:hypothetical protein
MGSAAWRGVAGGAEGAGGTSVTPAGGGTTAVAFSVAAVFSAVADQAAAVFFGDVAFFAAACV